MILVFEIIFSIIALVLFVKAITLAVKIGWGVTKILAVILLILALPVFILCLIFAGGLLLILPVALIAGAVGLLIYACK